ncbi:hypothetical protein [Flavobacterium beibuense]|uniref:hypothetical protein n=1 Tax=Flavobacterium beibuense TaxID=657326 RepID=UPI003A951955
MTLAFSTQLKGKPTYFVEKICKSLRELCVDGGIKVGNKKYPPTALASQVINLSYYHKCKPKHHTIRADVKDRWQPGKLIHFVINNRTKNRLQFAPVLKVVSIQEIEIRYNPGGGVNVFIDGNFFYYQTSWGLEWDDITKKQMLLLAVNDGFESIEDFFMYFTKDFKGKIIHWTNLKY